MKYETFDGLIDAMRADANECNLRMKLVGRVRLEVLDPGPKTRHQRRRNPNSIADRALAHVSCDPLTAAEIGKKMRVDADVVRKALECVLKRSGPPCIERVMLGAPRNGARIGWRKLK